MSQLARDIERRILVTEKEDIGDVHPHTKKGDFVCFLAACSVPVVLRPREEGDYVAVGNVTLQGQDVAREIGNAFPSQKIRLKIY